MADVLAQDDGDTVNEDVAGCSCSSTCRRPGCGRAVGIVDAVLRGADAIVDLDSETADVLEAIDIVATGGTLLTPADARAVVESARMRLDNRQVITLTPREIDILESIERGESVKQTARALGIAIKTVENLQSRLFRKLGARNRAQAISRAYELGLLDDAVP